MTTKHEAHTPEPWIYLDSGRFIQSDSWNVRYEGGAAVACSAIIMAGNVAVAAVLEESENYRSDSPVLKANASRIVAAVNACAGIETYALELMTGELSILNQISATTPEKLTPKATQYRQQRDKLLAVLVDLVNQPQDITTPAYQSALAVIQECEK